MIYHIWKWVPKLCWQWIQLFYTICLGISGGGGITHLTHAQKAKRKCARTNLQAAQQNKENVSASLQSHSGSNNWKLKEKIQRQMITIWWSLWWLVRKRCWITGKLEYRIPACVDNLGKLCECGCSQGWIPGILSTFHWGIDPSVYSLIYICLWLWCHTNIYREINATGYRSDGAMIAQYGIIQTWSK